MGDAQHGLRCGQHADQRTVFGHQHVAAARGGAARQKNPEVAALRIGGVEAAFLPHVPVEFDRGGAFEQHRGQPVALGNEFGNLEHQNRK